MMDWSATAAWIALAISITGTIVGPIATAIITNRHQLKLRKLDIAQRTLENYESNRSQIINNFISQAGRCLSNVDEQSVMDFGAAFHCVYPFVDTSFWPVLDDFYLALINYKWTDAKSMYPNIVHMLAGILKETLQLNP